MKYLLIIFFLFLTTSSVFANDAKFDQIVDKGIKEIYNIEFDKAEVTFRSLIADYPKHPAGRFFLAMIDWWKILIDLDNESHDDLFYQKLEDVIYQCDEILENDSDNEDALFFKGGAIGFRGRLRAYRESWIKAADDGREALPIVERAAHLNPSNNDVQLGFGIYNYYAAIIPDKYPMLKPLMVFFPKGDKEKGLKQLMQSAQSGKYTKYESRYFLLTNYYMYENDMNKALEYSESLLKDFPNNPVFEKWAARIWAKKGDYGNASKVCLSILDKADKNYYGYNTNKTIREAAYYAGLKYQFEGNRDSAKIHLTRSAESSKKVDKEPSGFYINAVMYLAMINDAQGRREEAVKMYNELLEMKEYGRSHRVANEYLKTPYK